MSTRLLFRLLILLLDSCYLGSVYELDAEQCRQNFAKECHTYVGARPEVDVPATQPATPAAVPVTPRRRALRAAARMRKSGSTGAGCKPTQLPQPTPRRVSLHRQLMKTGIAQRVMSWGGLVKTDSTLR